TGPVLLTGFALLWTSLMAALCARRLPYFFTGWFWFLGTLVPVIGFMQVGAQSMADRHSYTPYIGVFIILAWGVADLTKNWPKRNVIVAALSTAALAACLWLTEIQIGYWKDSATLFSHAVAVTAHNSIAHNNLGEALTAEGRLAEAQTE